MRIALLGAPGAGKGVQAGRLAGRYGIPQVTPVDLMREAIAAGSALGQLARAALDASQPVPDEILLALIRERLSRPDADKGFILDGFPRTLAQAEALDAALLQLGKSLQLVLLVDVDLDLLMQRLSGRRSCRSCGWACNVYSSPPRVDGVCDECGGNLRHRADDNEDTIGNRFRVYETQAAPVNRYYRIKAVLREVDGAGDMDQVTSAMQAVMEVALPEMELARADAEVAATPARAVLGKKAAARKQVVKKKSVKKTVAKKKAVAMAPALGKAATKKKTTKKTATTKKADSKKVEAKKTATKKLPAKQVGAKKAAKKAAGKTTAKPAKRTAVPKKKAVPQRPARPKTANKVPAKKVATKSVKKAVPKSKAAPKKKVAGKAGTKKKIAAKPVTNNKLVTKKAAKQKPTKRVAKKAPEKKKARRR